MSVHSDANFLGNLTSLEYDIEHEKLEIIKKHISKFPEYLPNQEMIERLQQALKRRNKISGADASFYFHELKEAELMEQGYDWYEAYPDDFNKNWRKAWGLE